MNKLACKNNEKFMIIITYNIVRFIALYSNLKNNFAKSHDTLSWFIWCSQFIWHDYGKQDKKIERWNEKLVQVVGSSCQRSGTIHVANRVAPKKLVRRTRKGLSGGQLDLDYELLGLQCLININSAICIEN